MNDFDDLDDVFGPLRSAATDAELADEMSHVDAMVRHHRRQKGHIMFTSRRARVATFVAAGVIGFGGIAAAASPGGPFALNDSDDTTTTSEVTTTTSEVTTTTSEVPTTTSEVTTTTSEVIEPDDMVITQSVIEEIPAAADAPLVDDPATPFDDTICLGHDPADFDNHGEFVSKVARNEPGFEDIEQRDAAQSSCGKDGDDADDSDDAEGPEDQDEVDVEVEIEADDDDDHDDAGRPEQSGRPDKPGRPESPGKSGNQGNGSKKNGD